MNGEFEKRMEKWQDDDMMLFQLDMIRKEDILNVIDEAKKEFPTYETIQSKNREYWKDMATHPKFSYLLRQELNMARDKWFKKWFGDKK